MRAARAGRDGTQPPHGGEDPVREPDRRDEHVGALQGFRALARTRLLEVITPELKAPPERFWDSLAAIDPSLTNKEGLERIALDDFRTMIAYGMNIPSSRRILDKIKRTHCNCSSSINNTY